jgi:polyisoprenoid-binding protein YceI
MALHTISSTPQTYWEIDPENTSIEFAIGKSFLHRVRGRFHGVRGSVVTRGDQIDDATIEVEIDAASIGTRLKVRDRHLREDRFLGVERFPTISFVSTRVEEHGPDQFRVFGELTIRGIPRQIVLDARVEQRDAEGGTIAAHAVLDRRDFQIGPKPMGLVVGNAVAVQIALTLRAR